MDPSHGGEQRTGPEAGTTEAYDALVARLERLVGELERGNLTLEQSLEKFAEGVKLARDAGRKLDEAERRIETLVRNADGSMGTEPFDPAGKGEPER